MRLGILTGDTGWGTASEETPKYYHHAPSRGDHTYCGISLAGAVPSGPPASGTSECPICAQRG